MLHNPETKYRPAPRIDIPDRTWPSKVISKAPRWCSVDLRDGNQALVEPMGVERKLRMFDLLVKAGFKEIEVAFPSASQTDFDFVRRLIEEGRIPNDVAIQVLTQAREDLIRRTFESLRGAHKAVVHFYNATSPLFRRVVFQQDQAGTVALAVKGAQLIRDLAREQTGTEWTFEYSPETFSLTELDFAVEICDAVFNVWQPTPDHPAILNLPATIEMATPNVYADQIELFCRKLPGRDAAVISIHPHNDRGSAVAAAEMAVMAGADRVEGCLFGHGERTGNVDLVTLALNLYTQGVSPGLDLSDMRGLVHEVEYCTQLPVGPRHPYAGDLVFTAFSGSHQDAIRKGFAAQAKRNDTFWEVPYLPLDPADVGCSYEAVIRVNSQSGKGGVAWVLEKEQGLELPRRLQIGFSRVVQEIADRTGKELSGADIWRAFQDAYHLGESQKIALVEFRQTGGAARKDGNQVYGGRIQVDGVVKDVSGQGNGRVSAMLDALKATCGIDMDVVDYHQHAIGAGAGAKAAAYVECRVSTDRTVFGVGIDTDVASASVKAILSAACAAREA